MVPSLLTDSTQAGFDRALHRAMSGIKGSAVPLRRVIAIAVRELTAIPMDASAALAHLNAIVENAGRGGAGDRRSLMSGQPRWMAIRDQVVEDARAAMASTPRAPGPSPERARVQPGASA